MSSLAIEQLSIEKNVSPTENASGEDEISARELHEIETKYGSTICSVRIRLMDIFHDFDPMRCGLMTDTRFARCISSSLERGHGNHLSPNEIAVLIKEYSIKGTRMVRWRDFVKKIDKGNN
jgi:hypothetical protein